MKIETLVDEVEIKKMVCESIANKIVTKLWEDDYSLDYDKRKADTLRRQQEIMAKIDWKNAGAQLSETVVQKFFMNLLEKR